MANRYWVGGSGTWSTTSTTNWSATPGGASGASAPTAADSVFFDRTGTYTVTLSSGLTCLDLTVTAGTVTFANGVSPSLTVSGSFTLLTGTVWSSSGTITFNATTTGKTITTNGVTMSAPVIFNGVGGGWTLGSAWTTGNTTFTVTNGSFDTGNYNLTISQFNSNNSNVRTITLGSSTLSINSSLTIASTNLTFNAGTSQINVNGATFAGGGLTYYNVALTSSSLSATLTGANTFNTLSIPGRTNVGVSSLTFSANQTITTLTLNAGTNAAYRTFLSSDTFGTQRTLTVTTLTAGAADYDFRDIAIAGTASPISGTRFGDAKGNSGITFSSKTVYWNLSGAQSWSATGWATSSGGSPAAANFPLAQDTAVFDDTGSVTGTITVNTAWNIGTIDMSVRTSAMTLATGSSTPTIYGNWINGSGTTLTGTGALTLAGRGSQTITSAGKSFTQPITINSPGGTVTPQDAFTTGAVATTLTAGTLSLGTFTWTTGSFTCGGGTLAFGTGNISLTGSGGVFTGSTSTTVTGTPNVYLTYSGASSVAIAAGSSITEANSINFIITAGSYPLTTTSNHVVRTLDFSNGGTSTYTGNVASSAVTIYGDLICKTGMTWTAGASVMTFATTSGTKTITSAGLTIDRPMTFNGVGGTWQLQDALNIGSNTITLTNGTFDATTYNVTAGAFRSNNANTRTIAIGSGTWTLSGAGTTVSTSPWGIVTSGAATNLTVTGTGTLSFTSASTKTFFGGAATYPILNQGGSGILQIGSSANTFTDITATYTATGATTITFPASTTQTVSQFTGSGASGKLLTLNSGTSGTQATVTLSGGGTVSTDYLNVQDIAFTPLPATDGTTPYVWYLGANSTNSGNNTGGLFQAGGAGALKVYQITDTATTSWTVPSDWNSSSNTIHLIGAGGGGGGSRYTSTVNKAGGGGGGGGGYTSVTNYSTTPSSSITVAVGTGGTAGASSGGTGGTGGTTSWATTNTATGGTGGSTTTTPTSVGGTGGSGTYSGGTGGAGSTTTTSGVIVTGGGGGGAAGPNGAGGAGGIGFANATVGNTAGGGGGGNGGGSAGGNASSATGGTGGNNFGGTGGGASNTAGTGGGGGGGGVNAVGKSGGTGIDILNTIGGGGGSGGSAGASSAGLIGVVYGAGGSGGSTNTTTNTGGAGAQGLIVIAYTPSAGVASNTNFFMMFN